MKKQSRRAASKSRATQTSRYWGVSRHHHTGHILPHRHTSYPILAMVVLCVGVLLASWTQLATADDSIVVTARVAGVAPPPATITAPVDGSVSTTSPIQVTGSCPPNTYVQIFRNSVPSGVAICDGTNTYTLQISLFSGANSLIARTYNFGDTPGPDSSPVAVQYNPPAEPTYPVISSDTKTPATGSTAAASPLLLKTDFHLKGFYVHETANWQLYIEGGTAPYALSVDWGDGHTDLISRPKAGTLDLQHTYDKPGGYKGSYQIKVTATDSYGQSTFLQVLSIVNNLPGGVAGTGAGVSKGIGILSSGQLGWLARYAWPAYGVVLMMLASFWLGAQHEYGILRVLSHKPRRPKLRAVHR